MSASDIEKILCPLDLSPHSQVVADYTAKMARQLRSEVIILYVAPEFTEFVHFYVSPVPIRKPAGKDDKVPASGEEHHNSLIDEARTVLDKLIADNFAGIKTIGLLVKGSVVEEIIAAANEQNVDLIIMGTQGRTGLERILLGSVAEQVIKIAPVPVMTIRPQPQGA
ncbi:MAG: universal stress protein [Desulfarculales bacterium]|jgi:nucleotide-binding universal stress UspA family protein|nr:universal stress protein [Desulfarculales bacterium]